MRYRGLTWNDALEKHEWIYGMPSYGSAGITEIETPERIRDAHFHDIIPESLGDETEYRDRSGKTMFTGDIVTLEVDGETRELTVVRTTMDRECRTLPGFEGETAKVRLAGVIAFRWTDAEGETHDLLPCVNPIGTNDTSLMEIIDTEAERTLRKNESEGEER